MDFDIEVRRETGLNYTVAVSRSPSGEATEIIQFPFDEQQLERYRDKLRIAFGIGRTRQICPEDEQPVQDFGRELFNTLFIGEVRSRYDMSRHIAGQQDMGLRVRLYLDAPELVALPWEFLYDSRQGDYICLSRNTPVVRYLELPQEVKPLSLTPPLRILCMVASPNDRTPLDVTREKTLLENAVRPLRERGLVELVWSEGQTWRDLQQKMRDGPWHIFHFIGHGGFDKFADEGFIALTADDGSTYPLHAQQLARLLADHASLRLVVLNSCEGARSSGRDVISSTSSILVRRGIPAVVAMQYEISDEAAIEFARSFYESLAIGYPVDTSMAEARKAMSTALIGSVEWGTPVLYLRSPDGMLFKIDRSREFQPFPAQKPEPAPVSIIPSAPVQVEQPAQKIGGRINTKSVYPKGFVYLGILSSLVGIGLIVLAFFMSNFRFEWMIHFYPTLFTCLTGVLVLSCGIFLFKGNLSIPRVLFPLNLLTGIFIVSYFILFFYEDFSPPHIAISLLFLIFILPGLVTYAVFRHLQNKHLR